MPLQVNAPIGLIAGGGQFPLLFAEAAQKRGRPVLAVCHLNETAPELEQRATACCWVKLGQLGKIIKFFHSHGVTETVFCGTITKTRIFRDILPDLKGLTLWNKIDTKLDDGILRAVAAALEDEGIAVLASTCYLEHLLFPQGILGKRKPTEEQWADIRFGWRIAQEIGKLDIGQCVVVREGSVLAVEAIEGTDAAIRRGGELAGSGAVVVKLKKPGQDFRFDLPATGVRTIETLASVKGAVLAVEAGQSLIFDREAMIAAADKAGIAVVGLQEGQSMELFIQ
jgi:hypothetical protein